MTEMTTDPSPVQRARVTALIPIFAQDRLTLGELRAFVAALTHLPDDWRVRYSGSMNQRPWGKPMSSGVLEVVEIDGLQDTGIVL